MPGVTTAYQAGNHAGRPAASSGCILYSCTEHGLVYRSDGTTWTTWLTLGGGTPDAHAASHENGGSDEIDVTGLTGAGGGGSAVDWNQDVNESGASFANFTANTGTWASNGTVITQTNTDVAHRRARYNTLLPIALPAIYEAEVKITSGTGALAGFLIGYNGAAGTGGIGVALDDLQNRIQVENGAVAIHDVTMTPTVTTGTFYKLRAIVNGVWVTVYVDGTLLGTANLGATNTVDDPQAYVGLFCFGAAAEFRNIKVWTLSTGLPA